MRRLTDASGAEWDVTIGRESWGTLVLLFVPRAGGGARQAVMKAETQLAAERRLQEMSEEELQERLATATPWGEA
jgi:hypothetical protein